MDEIRTRPKRIIPRPLQIVVVLIAVMVAIAFCDWLVLQFIIYTTPSQ
jgi:hypothetical protein